MSLPDWELAPLSSFSPNVLRVVESDDAERALLKNFTLMLALVFNDLKDLSWLGYQVRTEEIPLGEEISPRAGQKNGMRITVERWAQAIIFEFFELVRRNSSVLENKNFRIALDKVPTESRAAWSELVAVALHTSGTRASTRKLFATVRNKSAFHYWENLDDMQAGYVDHFVGAAGTPQAAHAYASLGKTMEGTRFYFADAAAGAVIKRYVEGFSADLEHVNRMGRYVNRALGRLVEELLLYFERTSASLQVS
jgi:hypothetical protein